MDAASTSAGVLLPTANAKNLFRRAPSDTPLLNHFQQSSSQHPCKCSGAIGAVIAALKTDLGRRISCVTTVTSCITMSRNPFSTREDPTSSHPQKCRAAPNSVAREVSTDRCCPVLATPLVARSRPDGPIWPGCGATRSHRNDPATRGRKDAGGPSDRPQGSSRHLFAAAGTVWQRPTSPDANDEGELRAAQAVAAPSAGLARWWPVRHHQMLLCCFSYDVRAVSPSYALATPHCFLLRCLDLLVVPCGLCNSCHPNCLGDPTG
jgi:hypothetical protein